MEMKVCIFQFDIQWLDPSGNIELIANKLKTTEDDIDLLVLPEMYLSGFCMDGSKSAVKEDGPEIEKLHVLAKKHKIGIIGSLAILEDGKYYNRVILISEKGIIGRYDKQYLYSPSRENEAFATKYDTNIMSFKGFQILPQVCYDLRFPENVRPLKAPDVLIYMANWPQPRIHHWDALLKARAIENQCFTIGCNRLGKDGNEWEYPGHSTLIKPNGLVVELNNEEGSAVVKLSLKEMSDYRSKYRFLDDKKV